MWTMVCKHAHKRNEKAAAGKLMLCRGHSGLAVPSPRSVCVSFLIDIEEMRYFSSQTKGARGHSACARPEDVSRETGCCCRLLLAFDDDDGSGRTV